MGRSVTHKRTGTIEGWARDVPIVLCGRAWVSNASRSDRLVTCKDCLRMMAKTDDTASTPAMRLDDTYKMPDGDTWRVAHFHDEPNTGLCTLERQDITKFRIVLPVSWVEAMEVTKV